MGLLTLRGRELLARAEVVVHDHLVNRELLGWAPPDAEIICAGKRPGHHAMAQEDINALLVQRTAAGALVVRLKGGDPFLFGRGAEEAAALAAAGLPFEVVPGVSSALAGPAYAGIPVTERTANSVLTIFTGHEDPAKPQGRTAYTALGAVPGTKVLLMGMENLRGIAEDLMAGGTAPTTPSAVVQWATRGDQRTVIGPLETIAAQVEQAGLGPPAVVVVGEVVNLREKLDWATARPLHGRRIVVTRSRGQASTLSTALRDRGAEVYEAPLIRFEPPEDRLEFGQLVQDAHLYDWIIFTSANGVEAFFELFFKIYDDAREFGGARIAAVGAATAARIRDFRFKADLVAPTFTAESLLEAFKRDHDVENQRLLVVRPADSPGVLPRGLTALGGIVDEAVAYRTVPERGDRGSGLERLREEGAEMVVFTSSSTVRNFVALQIPLPPGLKFASIGPVTSETMAGFGLRPDVEAATHDIPGLVEAITQFYRR